MVLILYDGTVRRPHDRLKVYALVSADVRFGNDCCDYGKVFL